MPQKAVRRRWDQQAVATCYMESTVIWKPRDFNRRYETQALKTLVPGLSWEYQSTGGKPVCIAKRFLLVSIDASATQASDVQRGQ